MMFLCLNLGAVFALYSDDCYVLSCNYLVGLFLAFVLITMIAVAWAEDPSRSGAKALTLFQLGINNLIIYTILKRYNLGNYLLWGILFSAAVNQLVGLNIISFNFARSAPARFTGTMGNPNGMAILMLFSLLTSMILLLKKLNVMQTSYHFINIILSLYIILLTASKKGAVFGLLTVCVWVISSLRSIKKISQFVVFLLICVIVFHSYVDSSHIIEKFNLLTRRFEQLSRGVDFKENSGSTKNSSEARTYYLLEGFAMFRERPILGWGMDSFSLFHGHYSHCNYTEILLGSGLIGALTYFSIYLILLIRILAMKKSPLTFYLFFFVLFLLLLGVAMVNYYSKMTMLVLIYLSHLADLNRKKNGDYSAGIRS